MFYWSYGPVLCNIIAPYFFASRWMPSEIEVVKVSCLRGKEQGHYFGEIFYLSNVLSWLYTAQLHLAGIAHTDQFVCAVWEEKTDITGLVISG